MFKRSSTSKSLTTAFIKNVRGASLHDIQYNPVLLFSQDSVYDDWGGRDSGDHLDRIYIEFR